MSEWMAKSKVCPSCNEAFIEIKQCSILASIIKTFLQENPDHSRDAAELQRLEKVNTLKAGYVVKPEKPKAKEPRRERRQQAEDAKQAALPGPQPVQQMVFDNIAPPAQRFALPNALFPPQIVHQPYQQANLMFGRGMFNPFANVGLFNSCIDCNRLGNYGCGRIFQHVKCQACYTDMPLRPGLNQRCQVCLNHFCNTIFPGSQCQTAGVRPIQLHPLGHYSTTIFNTLPYDALNSNTYERGVLEAFLTQKRLNFEYVFNTLFQGQTLNISKHHADFAEHSFRRDSLVCLGCAQKVWRELLSVFRIGIENSLAQEVKTRPRCREGRDCALVRTDQFHARAYTHYYL